MKKIALLLSIVSVALFTSCEGDQGPAGPAGPDSIVYEILDANFAPDGNQYRIYRTFNQAIGFNLYDSESVLVYRMNGTLDPQTPIWQLIPRTVFLEDGNELDYDFDFTVEDFAIYARGNYDLSTTPEFLSNQTFRIVVIPGYFQNRGGVDYNDYNAVIKKFNIDDSNVTQL